MKITFITRPASKRYFLFLRTFIALILVSFVSKNESFAQNSVALVIDPAASSVQVNQTFTVDVLVDFGTGSLSAVDAYVNFNPLDLEVTMAPTVPASTQTDLPGISVNFNDIATINSLGQVDHGRFTTSPIASHPDADFVLFTITFRALRVPPGGTTSIEFNTVPVRQTLAVESGLPILSGTSPGTILISPLGCTTPNATISAPGGIAICNSQPFNLMLASASNGTGPFDLTIEGPTGTATYDNIPVGGVITNFVPSAQKLWPDVVSPLPPTNQNVPRTLGVAFTSSVPGFVKGIRFFSPDAVSSIPGNYTGQLWSESGTLLASGTFTGVTPDSWQQLMFSTPVFITPGVEYIASYNTGVSDLYVSSDGFLSTNFTNGPLTALEDGGVYNNGSAVVFPGINLPPPFNGGTDDNNYWVDVVFSASQYNFNLLSVKDALECTNAGTLQTLSISSVDCATLPVSLLNFSATPKDNSIILTWSTASEINNSGFEIQRKTESGNWAAIGYVKGAGTSHSTHHYNYTDEKLAPGRYHYRLKQIDIDGRFDYSPVVSASIGTAEKFTLEQNYPNPFRNETIVRFTLPGKTNVKLSLYDMQGRLVKTLINGSRDKGTHAVTVQAATLTSGLYYYKLETENFSAVKKMTIQ